MRGLLRFGILPGLTLLFYSCQETSDPFGITTEEPTEEDLIGTYVFKEQSVYENMNVFEKNGAEVVPQFVLRPNGMYKALNIPLFKTNPPSYEELVTNKGKWQKGTAENQWGIVFLGLPDEIGAAGLMNQEPPYQLIFYFSDDESDQVMVFEQQQEE